MAVVSAWFRVVVRAVASLAMLLAILLSAGAETQPVQSDEDERIVITGKLPAPDSRSLPEQVTVISADQIAVSAAVTVADILAPVPGVAVTRYGGASSASFVSIRGSSFEQVLVLVNGRRVNSAQGGGVDLSMISPDAIERIEVYRGGMSAQYGDAAVGGVINIVLKDTGKKPFALSGSAAYGSFNTLQGSVGIQLWSDEHDAGAGLQLHGLVTEGSDRNNDDILRGGASASLSFQPRQRLQLELDARYFADEKGVPGTAEFPSATARMQDTSWNVGGDAELTLSQSVITVTGMYSHKGRNYRDPEYFLGPVDDTHLNDAWEGEAVFKHLYVGAVAAVDWQAGYSFGTDRLRSTAVGSLNSGSEQLRQLSRLRHAVSVQAEVMPLTEGRLAELRVYPALRLDSWSDPDTADPAADLPQRTQLLPSAKTGILLPVDARGRLLLKATAGTAFRAPSFDDLFWPATAFAEGNPELVPEQSYFADAGFVLQPDPALTLETAVFYRSVADLIQWTLGPSGTWRPINIGQADFWGTEVELRGLFEISSLNSHLELQLNGNLLRPLDRTRNTASYGKYLPRRPLWQGNAGVSFSHVRGHSLKGAVRHAGVRYITAANTKRLEPYTVIDLTASAAISETLTLTAAVRNAGDVAYTDVREYPIPGRELRMEVKYGF